MMKTIKALAFIFVGLLTAPAFAAKINTPIRVGVVTGKPFLYLVPATGAAPLRYSAQGLPAGLRLDPQTGIISGTTSASTPHTVTLDVRDRTGKLATKKVVFAAGADNVALTPIMGWNPWYVWGCQIDDKKIRQAADLLVSTGLAAHGYNYINLDDCWAGGRNAQGEIVPNRRFPDMKGLADYVHSKGLRIGIYTSPGSKTCAGYPGTEDFNYETQKSYLVSDVRTYAKWGMDLVKYDWCMFPKDKAEIARNHSKMGVIYKRMSTALARSPRAMVHMMCQYGERNVWQWGARAGGQSWRTDHDLSDDWRAILRAFGRVAVSPFASPGHYNDLDMLMVGKGNWPGWKKFAIPNAPPRPTMLTSHEQLTHMTLWSLMASPLIYSGDLSQIDPWTLKVVTNDDMISINQDPLAKPVVQIRDANGTKILARRLADGSTAVALFNLNSVATDITVMYDKFGLPPRSPIHVKNVWTGEELASDRAGIRSKVPPHGVLFVKLKN
jgi:alpha-galactosidase